MYLTGQPPSKSMLRRPLRHSLISASYAPGPSAARTRASTSRLEERVAYAPSATAPLRPPPFSGVSENIALATADPRPLRRYVPPQAEVGVVPYLGAASGIDAG